MRKFVNVLFCLTLMMQAQDKQLSAMTNDKNEANEVYALVNIAIVLTPTARANKDWGEQDAAYYQKISKRFDEYKDYKVIRDFDALLQKDPSAQLSLRQYSRAYEFGKNNKLVEREIHNQTELSQTSNLLAQFIPQLEVFAISSNFRKFYKDNRKTLLPANGVTQNHSFQTINVMDDFWKFWAQAETVDIPTQIKLYRELVIAPHKEIFAAFTGQYSDEEFTPYFKVLPKLTPKLKTMSKKLDNDLPQQIAQFKQNFPDMAWNGTIVFMPNYGSFDSGGGVIDGKGYQIFGVDTIALTYGENADLSVLFSHELFHLYLEQFHPELNGKNREKGEIPLYWMIWNEGLATYASQRLNPNVTFDQIFLTTPTAKEAAPILPKLAKKVLANFEGGAPEIWRPFMAAEKLNDEIPSRSGYFVGYKIAEELGKKMSLQKLAQLKGEELKKRMRKVLSKLEK